MNHDVPPHGVSLGAAIRIWAQIAALSFGGPAGQIALMHRVVVEEQRWIGEERFLHALNYCMLLPGPEAQQLATYIGWLMHGVRGGLIAGGLFVLPGLVAIMGLSWIYALFGAVPLVAGVFFGLKAAVLALVLSALIRIGGRALKNTALGAIAAASFIAIFLFNAPFPAIIAAAAALGYLGGRWRPTLFHGEGGHAAFAHAVADADSRLGVETPAHARPNLRWSLTLSAVFLALWWGPVAGLVIAFGPDDVYSRVGVFFSQMAVVTFGGAYAVLAYVAQQAVETYGWLSPGEMLDGLGMAETTPGPLIMVLQFVGFMAGFRAPGSLPPLLAGTLAGLLATWVTFTPCFLWIFLGAPFIERLRGNHALSAAMAAITAAVVGVILNLALWFSLHTLFRELRPVVAAGMSLEIPVWASLDPAALALTAAAILAVFRFKLGLFVTLGGCALAGLALRVFW